MRCADPVRKPHAVLLRACIPISGIELMRKRRAKARRDRDLCSGPGKLGQAFAIDRSYDGSSLLRGPLRIVDDGMPPPRRPARTPRIGIAAGKDDERRYRFLIESAR